jgi:hypothetical protein
LRDDGQVDFVRKVFCCCAIPAVFVQVGMLMALNAAD